jgi:hypothetical protein
MVEGAMSVEEDQITYGYHPAEPILLGPQIDYSDGKSDYDGLMEFYEFCKKWDPHMNLNWSAWGLFNGERIVRGDWRYPDRYYFNRPSSPDKKPAGYYVTAYTRGNYGQTANLYERILAFIKKNGLTVVGNCFEAYVLNEIVLPDPQHYLIRASLQVDERDLGTAK